MKKNRGISPPFLKKDKKVFAQSYIDMFGLDPKLVVPNLELKLDAKPVRKKLIRMHPTIAIMVKDELQKLL